MFGGTFDPVHIAHLRVAWEASEALDAQVRMMPAHVPPHRSAPVASAAQRVAMLRAALAGQERLVLDTRELDRDEPSYTVDTLRAMRTEFGTRQPLVLLLGADAFAGLPTWHRWSEIFVLAHVAILTRPGHGAVWPSDLSAMMSLRGTESHAELDRAPAGRITRIAVTPLEISASAVRAVLAEGRDPRWLLPQPLLEEPGLLAPYRRERR